MASDYVLRDACEFGDHDCDFGPETGPCNCACHILGARWENARLMVPLQPCDRDTYRRVVREMSDSLAGRTIIPPNDSERTEPLD